MGEAPNVRNGWWCQVIDATLYLGRGEVSDGEEKTAPHVHGAGFAETGLESPDRDSSRIASMPDHLARRRQHAGRL